MWFSAFLRTNKLQQEIQERRECNRRRWATVWRGFDNGGRQAGCVLQSRWNCDTKLIWVWRLPNKQQFKSSDYHVDSNWRCRLSNAVRCRKNVAQIRYSKKKKVIRGCYESSALVCCNKHFYKLESLSWLLGCLMKWPEMSVLLI